MATYKLYQDDSYVKDFIAAVVSCTKDNDSFKIALDHTAFYPEGGGQPFDTGFLLSGETRAEIFKVLEQQGEIYHYSNVPLPVGATVKGFINFDRRFDLMQQHTGEHILSGLTKKLFGFDNVGFHLSDKDMSVDFNGALSKDDIDVLVKKANEIILKNQEVVAFFPDDVKGLNYRSKKELSGMIRIVKAGDADVCACCGTHTRTTSEVVCVAVLDFASYKGGTRLSIACGGRCFADHMAKNSDCYKISHLLSSKIGEIVPAVEAKISENELLKQEVFQLRNQLYFLWAQAVPSGRVGFFEKDGLGAGQIQKIAQILNERCEIAVACSLQEDGSCKICVISSEACTSTIGTALCEKLIGKGGGKKGIFQCVVQNRCTRDILDSVLS